jgi:tRNA U38,U39,U40 pseudouridine synthase TruA
MSSPVWIYAQIAPCDIEVTIRKFLANTIRNMITHLVFLATGLVRNNWSSPQGETLHQERNGGKLET